MSTRPLLTHPVLRLLAFALALRVFTAGLGFIANVVFPEPARTPFTVLDETHHFWDSFARGGATIPAAPPGCRSGFWSRRS
jgi:hypothetical protein